MPSLARNASYRVQPEPIPSHHTPVSDEDVKYEHDGLETRRYGNVEEASDPEIQGLQQQLHHVRKRRRIMELRADIQQEQQLLFLAQQRIDDAGMILPQMPTEMLLRLPHNRMSQYRVG
jgi:hypothetical protein